MIVDAIRRLPVDRIVLDGEAVCLRPDGHPDFHARRSRQACRGARLMASTFWAWDGEYLMSMPLHERSSRLATVSGGGGGGGVVLRACGRRAGSEAVRACQSPQPGRHRLETDRVAISIRTSRDWWKIKNPEYERRVRKPCRVRFRGCERRIIGRSRNPGMTTSLPSTATWLSGAFFKVAADLTGAGGRVHDVRLLPGPPQGEALLRLAGVMQRGGSSRRTNAVGGRIGPLCLPCAYRSHFSVSRTLLGNC